MAQSTALIVGTARSVQDVLHQLAVAEDRPSVVGCVLPAAAIGQADPGCAVVGAFDDLGRVLDEWRAASRPVDAVLVSLPQAMQNAVASVRAVLAQAGVRAVFMPTLADQLAGRVSAAGWSGASTGPELSKLVDRPARPIDEQVVGESLRGRVVMVTGAGGSIGSELARRSAAFEPAELILVDRAENPLFEIDRQIAAAHPALSRKTVLHDVARRRKTLELVERHRPDVVFHAAAHKHVPMMEDHPAEAVENNLYGTRSIADAADAAGVGRLVMISTDKAVRPSSIMGASKRLAELYVQDLARRSATRFAVVRFGNVLGSACSVLPIWSAQLATGGPVTVTHPDMTRYFMTIPEAAGLVIQAGAIAEGGEVFLLDMGEPVNVLSLAQRFLREQGFEPGVDVEIRITGARPGEKLFEQLAYDAESAAPTPHESIRVWRSEAPNPAEVAQVMGRFDRLRDKAGDGLRIWEDAAPDAIVRAVRASLPEMLAPQTVGRAAG
ncbi:MAG: polysaccharide biosynthesis protein [Planctomycetota bacterium]